MIRPSTHVIRTAAARTKPSFWDNHPGLGKVLTENLGTRKFSGGLTMTLSPTLNSKHFTVAVEQRGVRLYFDDLIPPDGTVGINEKGPVYLDGPGWGRRLLLTLNSRGRSNNAKMQITGIEVQRWVRGDGLPTIDTVARGEIAKAASR